MAKFSEGLFEALALYVRQLAWLNGVPRRKLKQRSEDDGEQLSRREWYERGGETLPLPECPDEIAIEWLLQVGPVMAGGMGGGPITWQELAAWQDRMALDLQPWESHLLVRLSREYAGEQAQANDEDRPPPWADTHRSQTRREAIGRALKAQLSVAAQPEAAPATKTRRKRKKP